MVWDQRVAGSNPAIPTNLFNGLEKQPVDDCTPIRTGTTDSPVPVAPKAAKGGRPSKGPRIYLRNDADGSKAWIIRDNGKDIRTGCKEDNGPGAISALAAYNEGRPIETSGDMRKGLVYFVTCTTSPRYPIKIGWTNSQLGRMRQMQNGNPNLLTVLATIPGTSKDERALHRRFKHLHIRGEWFRHGDDLSAYVKALAGYSEAYGMDEFDFATLQAFRP